MNAASRVLGLVFVTLGIGLAAACGSGDVKSGTSGLGAIDAGTGKCGDAPCATGELCCASADESCTPTCMKVSTCPAYGRPCKTDDAGATALTWHETCGDPVCPGPDASPGDDAGSVACPALGSSCADKGSTCGNPKANCGVIRVCDDHDPKAGGCPISTRRRKEDIGYVGPEALQRLHDETLQMRLATYRYKGPFIDPQDPNARHLGFIIEDQPESLSVDRGHDRVDLYGYMSMAVATMQVQEKQIAELRREVAEIRATCTHTPR